MKCRWLLLSVTVIFFANTIAFCAPEPTLAPSANQWTLNVVFTQPQQITVRIPDQGKAQRFWYVIITVTNNSKIDVPFYPGCELLTDTMQVIPAYRDTRNIVFDKIKARHKKKFPFLESLEYANNKILQGQDNTKDFAIIWPDFDAKAKNISLFIAGLSNEITAVDHPTKKDPNGNPEKIYLKKTLELQYSIGGDESLRENGTLVFKGKRWVMR